jgi:hypothetical protein
MKQLLSFFLFLLPCLALAQYPSNGNQKITLGEQTTADGLIYRGVLGDTALITPLSDTSAYIILDTVNHRFYNYNRATNVWSVAGGGTAVTSITGGTGLTGGTITTSGTLAADTSFLFTQSDTLALNLTSRFAAKQNTLTLTTTGTSGASTLTGATLNIPQYSGGGGIDSTTIKYVNTYGTQTVNGSKTFSTAPTFSTALLGGSGGTGITSFGAANRIPYAASTTALTTSSALTFDASLGRFIVTGISAVSGGQSFIVNNSTPLALYTIANNGSITARGTGNIVFNSFSSGQNRYQLYAEGNTNNPLMFYIAGGAKGSAYGEFSMNGDFDANAYIGGGFLFDTRDGVAPPMSIMVKDNNANPVRSANFMEDGEVFIGYQYGDDKGNYRLQVKDSVYVGGNVSAAAYTTRSDYNLKDDIFDLKYGLNDILKLQPVEYTYKSNGSKQLGFIAQDIGTILPEVVSFEESMSVNYQAIIPILTKAIQEQNLLIKALEQRIINLENK